MTEPDIRQFLTAMRDSLEQRIDQRFGELAERMDRLDHSMLGVIDVVGQLASMLRNQDARLRKLENQPTP